MIEKAVLALLFLKLLFDFFETVGTNALAVEIYYIVRITAKSAGRVIL